MSATDKVSKGWAPVAWFRCRTIGDSARMWRGPNLERKKKRKEEQDWKCFSDLRPWSKEKSRLIFTLYVTLLFNFYSLDINCLATRNDQSTKYFGRAMSRLQRQLLYAFSQSMFYGIYLIASWHLSLRFLWLHKLQLTFKWSIFLFFALSKIKVCSSTSLFVLNLKNP